MQLRPYQTLAIAAIESSWEHCDRTLVQMATGSGKTIVFAHLLKQRLRGQSRQGFVLVHRQELLQQAVAKIQQVWPQVEIGIVQRQREELDKQVVVASIPSLYRRLDRIDPAAIGLVVVDEAHHAPARSWQLTIDRLTSAGAKCLGVTATPERDKRVGLGEVFEELCFTRSLPDLIPDYLCDLRAVRLQTELDLDGVRSRQGDFVVGELEKAVNTSARNQSIVEGWMRYGEGRQAVVYCVSVQHALQVAETFRQFGIAAATVSGRQSRGDRQAAIAQFQAGQLPILTNCLVLTEGWDYPHLQCLIMARPTQSSLLFTQTLGRGTRKADGKTDCLIIDIADNTRRHNIQTVHKLFGLAARTDLSQVGVCQRVKEKERAEIERLQREANLLHRMDVEIVDLLLSAEATLPGRFEWTPLAKGSWFLKIPEQEPKYGGDLLQIHYTADTGASLVHVSKYKLKELAAAPALQHLVEIADAWIDRHLRFATILLDRAADWRDRPATEMQQSYIRSLLRRIEPDEPELYRQVMEQLQHIESAEALREFYDAQGVEIPANIASRRLTRGLASQLISFLKQKMS
ncbi:DEAD/DEAH box helicase [Synechococcus sp. PCC 7336]|uniref:DEAD/DEAH box helicase n=1 Tax=Synechococcus sp. PCC 7336 TaxID=195250 RepID=UPI0003496CD4|nr:DEAD/DEAH box helicase [Synechococcus sp. PCC 7336]